MTQARFRPMIYVDDLLGHRIAARTRRGYH
jgi:hypothetical protein